MPLITEGDRDDQLSRRGLLLSVATSLICAPAVVRATSIMRVRPLHPILILPRVKTVGTQQAGWVQRVYYDALAKQLIARRPITVVANGEVVSVERAMSAVAYAKQCDFLAPSVAKSIFII